MAYIRQIEPEEATAELADFYALMVERAGAVPNIVKLSSLNLGAMRGAQDLYRSVLYQESGLSRLERELVATAVSVINGCGYCVDSHAAAIDDLDPSGVGRAAAVGAEDARAQLMTRTQAMLVFAEKLTLRPREMGPADVDVLRVHGLSDEDILDLVQVVCYFNYVNRLATALGVDPEPAR